MINFQEKKSTDYVLRLKFESANLMLVHFNNNFYGHGHDNHGVSNRWNGEIAAPITWCFYALG